ncbi:SMC-Scp complex subunit ScpB [Candidatus Woesearchaeota archaeon]|mgnify:CR=1 FL=1|nr:SMC-Scp complex subunit ScpB [Candidatus Woesearchaeota archaeon]RLE42838.1 MAG: SMC-Scp complex subunit ScpB [Candidatus Woesearchaeota archaeon]
MMQDTNLRLQVEALLFSSGRKMSVEELVELTGAKETQLLKALKQLQSEYNSKETSLIIIDENKHWKMSVKESYMPLVRRIVSETELPKGVLETLAVIAWKAPILQSQVIKIRNNKAYEHIAQLEDSGFITKERHGRSYKIKLTQKFFEYFDIESVKRLREQLERKQKLNKNTEG